MRLDGNYNEQYLPKLMDESSELLDESSESHETAGFLI
jgi:hypothetical protein